MSAARRWAFINAIIAGAYAGVAVGTTGDLRAICAGMAVTFTLLVFVQLSEASA